MTWVFWLYAVIAVPWAACAVAYGWWTKFERSGVGWGQFVTYLSLAAVLALAALFRVVHLPHAAAVALALVVLCAVGVAGCLQLVNVLRYRLGRDRRPSDR